MEVRLTPEDRLTIGLGKEYHKSCAARFILVWSGNPTFGIHIRETEMFADTRRLDAEPTTFDKMMSDLRKEFGALVDAIQTNFHAGVSPIVEVVLRQRNLELEDKMVSKAAPWFVNFRVS